MYDVMMALVVDTKLREYPGVSLEDSETDARISE